MNWKHIVIGRFVAIIAVAVMFFSAAQMCRADDGDSGPSAANFPMDTNVVVAQTEMLTNQFKAYAQVGPVAVLPVRAAAAGIVTHLNMVPGSAVQAGEKIAELGGPEIQSALAQAKAAVRGAQTNLLSAQKTLAIQKQQLAAQFATRQMILQAEGATALAQSALDAAQAQLRALRQTATLTAPADGTVLAVNAADGERVSAGETILTLQPAKQLWLTASYYGSDAAAIQVGMDGQFVPASGREPVAVKVAAVSGVLTPAGGESIGLTATAAPGWLNGEFGTVTLNGERRSLPVVPTRALILDRGRWWVLVRTEKGGQRQAVVPGPARGWQTFIQSGLPPGAQVLVGNVYLEFHRDISQTYQPPD